MNIETMKKQAIEALESLKAQNLNTLNVDLLTDMTDVMIFASGTSTRHVKSLARHLVETMKKSGLQPVGVEGEDSGDWVLVDLGDVVVHIMLPEMREFYDIERLWSGPPPSASLPEAID